MKFYNSKKEEALVDVTIALCEFALLQPQEPERQAELEATLTEALLTKIGV